MDNSRATAAAPAARRRRVRATSIAALMATGIWLIAAAVAGAEELVPPAGELSVDGAGPFVGQLGSWCMSGEARRVIPHDRTVQGGTTGARTYGVTTGCSDAGWLIPPTGPHARPNAAMVFKLADGREITSWTAVAARAAQSEPELVLGEGDTGGDPAESISFPGPPAGDWVVDVSVWFEGGDATYYFRVHVNLPETATVAPFTPPPTDQTSWLALLISAAAGGIIGWRLVGPHRRRVPSR